MRILLVSQMYPGPHDPDLGSFIAQVVGELEHQGHVVEKAVIDQRGLPKAKYPRLAYRATRKALKFKPDVIYAHFLAPAGAAAALASSISGKPLVLTAHGTDVRNIGTIKGARAATRLATRRASAVIAVSDYLRRRLTDELPKLSGRIEVIDCGVDLERFAGHDASAARHSLGWDGEPPFYLFVGSVDEHKNVVRLVRAFERLRRGRLAIVGDGPLRGQIEGRPHVRVVGRVPPAEVAEWMAACDVLCLPTLAEGFGQVLLEAMACERSVVATEVGGPPELVTPEVGALVNPESVESIEAGLREAAALPTPNPKARRLAAQHDVRIQAKRIADLLRQSSGS